MNGKEIRGKEIHDSLERLKSLENKAKNGGVSEPESMEHQELVNKFTILSLEDLQEYHEFMTFRIKESHVKKDKLIRRIKQIGTKSSQELLTNIVNEVFDNYSV